ncbi:MAG: DNA/RNA non-specific endonuclease [Bacteroidales bacterium]|nr:DNA/RNA non-specific endonuclease [Bacteroidales bacterium]
MRKLKLLPLLCVLGFALAACSKSGPASLNLLTSTLSVGYSGGSEDVSFLTNQSWSVSGSESWLTVSPSSGGASDTYQKVTITVAENAEEAERTAQLTLKAGELTKLISVTQEGQPRFTIRDFRAKAADKTTWYRLTGEIASISNDSYGNFYIVDETGYVYVYGLCETQQSTNDQSFSKLGLKVGDTVTMMTLRSEHNGTIEAGGQTPAYFVSKTAGEYKLGKKVSATKADWKELPATSSSDGQDLLIHYFPDGKRSYAAYYDYNNLVSSWVAYPLFSGNIGTNTGRTDSFSLDPLLPREKQQYNPSTYKAGNITGSFDRGHQIASADRNDIRVNIETFFGTNMTPQNHDLNGGLWGNLENKVRDWAKKSDTLYVVTGCTVAGSTGYVLDSEGKHITVPTGYYKALLRLADGAYTAAGFYFANEKPASNSLQKSMAISVDELEKKVGVDFFVNLPEATQSSVEAQNPAEVAWWWNN